MAPGNSKITPQVVQQVRDVIDIVDIAGSMTNLIKKGNKYEGLCPFHKEKTPSFNVDPDQGLFYCFGCSAGGDAIKLYMQHHGDDFPAAIESLALRYSVPLPSQGATYENSDYRDLGAVLEAAADFFRQQLQRSEFAQLYLKKRQISPELQQLYGLGYAPDDWRQLLQTLRRSFSVDDLLDAGLVARSEKSPEPYDRFRHRLMFSIHLPSSRLVGFGGRTLGDDRAKYINSSETEQFSKRNLLFGFHQAKRAMRDEGRGLLVEGYFDVLGAAASGIPWSVATMGTAITAEQARLLGRYTDEVIVAYDGDSAGEKAFRRALPILLAAGLGVKRARFPDGHDPDSLRLEKGPEAVREAIEQAKDGILLEIDRLAPVGQNLAPQEITQAASAVAEILTPIRDKIVQYSYGQKAAERLGIPLEMLWRRVGRATSGSKQRTPPPTANPQNESSPANPISTSTSNEVVSAEEKALALLLQAEESLPPVEQLPPAEVFFDHEYRNIYAAFYALYKSGEQKSPSGSDVVAKLDHESVAIDRVARLLLKVSGSGEGSLQETLQNLTHRWRKKRQTELSRQIKLAQQQEDGARLDQLLKEKKTLSHSLHPEMTGKFW